MSTSSESRSFAARPEELKRAHAARDRAVAWLLDHVAANGEPADAAQRSGWPRLGWGLAVAGQQDAAAAVVDWVEANRLAADGSLMPDYFAGQSYISQYPNYWLGTFVVSAWLTGRADLALRSMGYLRRQQDPKTGGLPMRPEVAGLSNLSDMLSTAQVGLSALVTGQFDVADRCYRWVRSVAEQDARESLIFCAVKQDDELWRAPHPAFAWGSVVDFGKARQAFYSPGMGAVFLALYAQVRQSKEAIEAARRLLQFNMLGHEAQFTDVESVQACKFAWAVGAMHQADPAGGWLPWVRRMVGWFLDRQATQGWWGPSRFADPDPSIADRLVKTCEHVMELTVLIAALGSAQAAKKS